MVDDPHTPDPTRQSLETLLTVCIHLVSVCAVVSRPSRRVESHPRSCVPLELDNDPLAERSRSDERNRLPTGQLQGLGPTGQLLKTPPTFWIQLILGCSLNPNPLTKSIAVLSLVLLWYPAITVSLRKFFQARETVFPPSRKRIPEPTRQSLKTLPTVLHPSCPCLIVA